MDRCLHTRASIVAGHTVGYSLFDTFRLPAEAWWKYFYGPHPSSGSRRYPLTSSPESPKITIRTSMYPHFGPV